MCDWFKSEKDNGVINEVSVVVRSIMGLLCGICAEGKRREINKLPIRLIFKAR